MAALDQTFANSVLNLLLNGTALTVTTPLHARLMTANGTATSNGTELTTGSGYTAGTGAPSAVFATGAASGSISNSTAVSVSNMPACVLVGAEVWNSNGTPGREFFGPLAASKTINAGDTFSIAIGSFTVTLV